MTERQLREPQAGDPYRGERLRRLYLNAGQMKAGTTYLFGILKHHREIYFSPEKELNYLSQRYGTVRILSDFVRRRKAQQFALKELSSDRSIYRYQYLLQWAADYLRPVATPGWYEDMFKGIRDGQWAADFSNLTCTMPVDGLRQVEQMADEVRVTYCFRDPVARAFSHAKFHLQFGKQDSDLTRLPEDALRALLTSPSILPQSQTEEHIDRLLAAFGPARVRLIQCEEMWADPQKTVDAICRFLNIPPLESEIAMEPVNVGPEVAMTPELRAIFEDVFAPYREGIARVRAQYGDLMIS